MFFIKMPNELSLYVLVVHSAHLKSSVNSDIQGSVDWTRQFWWDKPARKLDDGSFINHLCTTVQHSDAFQHLCFLGKGNTPPHQSFTTCGLHAVSRRKRLPSITAYSKYLCGQLDSAVVVEIPSVMFKRSWTHFMFYTTLLKCCASFILLFNG